MQNLAFAVQTAVDDLEIHECDNSRISSELLPEPDKPDGYEIFLLKYKGDLCRLKKDLSKAKIKTVCLEAGHIYVDEQPHEGHRNNLCAGAHLKKFLEQEGFNVVTTLFVDDYNPDHQNPAFVLEDYIHLR